MAPNRPFVRSPILTQLIIGYSNPAHFFIADEALPRTDVAGELFKWTEFPLEEGFRVVDNRVGRTGRVARVEFTGKERESAVEDFGLDAPVPESDIDAAAQQRAAGLSNFDPERRAVIGLEDYNQIAREMRVARLLQDAASYPSSQKLALSGGDQLSDYENSNPIAVIKHCLRSTLVYRPNQIVMGPEVWDFLSSHPKLVNAVRGNLTSQGIITKDEFARLFSLRKVLVGESYMDAARWGQDAQIERVWGRNMIFQYVDPNPMPDQGRITHGFTAVYGTKIAGHMLDPNVGLQGGRVVRAGERVKELICAPGVSFLLQDVVQPV